MIRRLRCNLSGIHAVNDAHRLCVIMAYYISSMIVPMTSWLKITVDIIKNISIRYQQEGAQSGCLHCHIK